MLRIVSFSAQKDPAKIAEIVADIDKDKDGELDKGEFTRWWFTNKDTVGACCNRICSTLSCACPMECPWNACTGSERVQMRVATVSTVGARVRGGGGEN